MFLFSLGGSRRIKYNILNSLVFIVCTIYFILYIKNSNFHCRFLSRLNERPQSYYPFLYIVLVISATIITLGRSWVAVEQTLKFLPLARVRNDIVYEPEASRQCHSLREQEEEISMSARLPPRNDIVSIYVKPPLNK